jgi:hypothetical protein
MKWKIQLILSYLEYKIESSNFFFEFGPNVAAQLCLLFLSIIYIQIHTHLKWEGYG